MLSINVFETHMVRAAPAVFLLPSINYMITTNPFLEKKVLVVTAHPDDEAYFAGALRQAVESGGEVRLMCATLGEKGRSYLPYECESDQLQKIRHAELLAAATAIGISQIEIGGYPDGELFDHVESFTRQIEQAIQNYRPDIVLGYGPDGYTGHADHVAAYTAAARAAETHHTLYAAFTLPPEPYRTELVSLLQAKRKYGVYAEYESVVEPSVSVQADTVFKSSLLQYHASQLQGLNPYTAFGEALGGHLMQYEYFHILS